MRKLSLVASLAVLLASQGCTFTIPSALLNGGLVKPVAQGGGGSTNPGCKPAFEKIDFDKDGAITAKEWEQARMLSSLDPLVIDVGVEFKTRDTNGDGKISFDEFANACKPFSEPGKPIGRPDPGAVEPPVGVGRPTKPPMPIDTPDAACSKEAAETVANYDNDGNGSLSYEEFAPWYDEKTAEMLGDCGVDYSEPGDDEPVYDEGEGEYTNWKNDTAVMQRRLSPAVSNNGGGLISNNAGGLISDNGGVPTACPSYPEAELAFQKADTDQSGELSAEEICRFPFFFNMPTPPEPPIMPQPEPYPVDGCKGSFLKSDVNGDGAVTPDEFFRTRIQPAIPAELVKMIGANQAMIARMPADDGGLLKAAFAKMDANGDGRIDPAEWCGEAPRPQPEPQPQPGNCDISAMDRNRDGFVSWEEFFGHNTAMIKIGQEGMARLKEELNAKFQGLDRNKDTQLDARELCGEVVVDPQPPVLGDSGECGKLFDQYDLDHNNQIGFNEYADVKWKQMVFIKAPTDQEAAAARQRFMDEAQKYDTNQDGRLSFVEFLNTCPNYVQGSVATTNR